MNTTLGVANNDVSEEVDCRNRAEYSLSSIILNPPSNQFTFGPF